MHSRQAAFVVVLVVVAVGALALPASGADQAANETAENDTEAGMGAQLTAFMQASAAETNDTVESGMWAAGFDRANESEQARLATTRTAHIEQRLERLRERNRTLQQRYENGSIPEVAYIIQTSQLAGRMDALRTSINDTASAAREAGVNTSAIERLRERADTMRAPAIPGVARGIATGQGPPAIAGPAVTDGANGPAATATGRQPGGPAARDPGNESGPADRGPPTEAGNGTGAENTTETTPSQSDPPNEGDTPTDTGPGSAGTPAESDETTATATESDDGGKGGPPEDPDGDPPAGGSGGGGP